MDTAKGKMPLSTYFELKYVPQSVNFAANTAEQYRISLRLLQDFHDRQSEEKKTDKGPVRLIDLTGDLVVKFMQHLRGLGRSHRTANNKRQAILTLWRHAAEVSKLIKSPPRIAKIQEPSRIVQAWDVDQVARLIAAARASKPMVGWDSRHRVGLLLTLYDTSHRIGAILKAERNALDLRAGTLLLKAEWTKQKADTLHRLHPETLDALRKLPASPKGLLFPWPLHRRAIWHDLRQLLIAAELPATRKDMFHKLRRTSFTYTYALLGESAARDHAGHTSNVTANYLDRALLAKLQNKQSPVDVLPRPK